MAEEKKQIGSRPLENGEIVGRLDEMTMYGYFWWSAIAWVDTRVGSQPDGPRDPAYRFRRPVQPYIEPKLD